VGKGQGSSSRNSHSVQNGSMRAQAAEAVGGVRQQTMREKGGRRVPTSTDSGEYVQVVKVCAAAGSTAVRACVRARACEKRSVCAVCVVCVWKWCGVMQCSMVRGSEKKGIMPA